MEKSIVLSFIARTGVAILVTIVSFVILPPTIYGENSSAVNFYNFFAFFAGVSWIILYKKFRNKPKVKIMAGLALLLLVGILFTYERLYNKYSVNCQDGLRIIISDQPVKKERRGELQYWTKKRTKNPIDKVLAAHYCVSEEVWKRENLESRFYTLTALYLLIILNVLLLLNLLASLVLSTPEVSPSDEK